MSITLYRSFAVGVRRSFLRNVLILYIYMRGRRLIRTVTMAAGRSVGFTYIFYETDFVSFSFFVILEVFF